MYIDLVFPAQALAVKSDIEVRRSANTFGILTWQLNEIWPTGMSAFASGGFVC